MKPFDYIKQITVCCFVILLCIGCGKSDMAMPDDPEPPSIQSKSADLEHLHHDCETDSCQIAANDIYYWCNGCMPGMSVTLETGVPVLHLSLTGSYICQHYEVEYTINGSTYTENLDTSIQNSLAMDYRVLYGQSCSGSVTVTCTNVVCKKNPQQKCSKTITFSFNENGNGGSQLPTACGKYLNSPSVMVTQRGQVAVEIGSSSISGYDMVCDRYILYFKSGNISSQIGAGSLIIGTNAITYSDNGGLYWIRMYNSAICGNGELHHYYADLSPSINPKDVFAVCNH